jgi:hypothetical protein
MALKFSHNVSFIIIHSTHCKYICRTAIGGLTLDATATAYILEAANTVSATGDDVQSISATRKSLATFEIAALKNQVWYKV